jgi:ankyrin repeat protein
MSTIAVANMVSPKSQHASPCTSASCCSPSRLWKQVQSLINTDNRDEFRQLCADSTKLPHVVRVILTSRLSNNPLIYKSTVTIDRRLTEKFGKLSATDLNALELALLQKHDHIAYTLLNFLKQQATPAECKQFLNHQWGKQGNTALHLAAFWGMSKLVRLMLEMEADPSVQNCRQLRPIDCTTQSDIMTLLEPKKITKRPSLLLKKAEKTMRTLNTSPDQYLVPEDAIRAPIMSPLSFSSSSSSSSSLSSFDYHCWTPPTSPIPQVEKRSSLLAQLPTPDLFERPGCFPRITTSSILDDDNDDDDDKQVVLPKQKKVQFDPQTILIDACIRGDQQEMAEVAENVCLDEMRDLQNRSLLHIALLHGQEHIVEFLSDKLDINCCDNDGMEFYN